MSIYYFEIADAKPVIPCVGEDLPSIAAARYFALKYAALLLCDQGEIFWDGEEWLMTVKDANHLTLFTIMICATAAPSTLKLKKII
jgi:hypothetical protein